MTIVDCTCTPIPVSSSRELEPGAEHKDVLDDDGRWHAVVIPGDPDTVYKQVLVAPSAAYLAAHTPPNYLEVQEAGVSVTEISILDDGVETKTIEVQVKDGETDVDDTSSVDVITAAIHGLVAVDKLSGTVDATGKLSFTFGPTSLCGVLIVQFTAPGLEGTTLKIVCTK